LAPYKKWQRSVSGQPRPQSQASPKIFGTTLPTPKRFDPERGSLVRCLQGVNVCRGSLFAGVNVCRAVNVCRGSMFAGVNICKVVNVCWAINVCRGSMFAGVNVCRGQCLQGGQFLQGVNICRGSMFAGRSLFAGGGVISVNSFMRAHSMRNSDLILHGDQT